MQVTRAQIGNYLGVLADYLAEIQSEAGGFEAKFYFPSHPERGWQTWGYSPYDAASVLLSIQSIPSVVLSRVRAKGNQFLINSGLDNKVWKYTSGQGYDPLLYDTDATALCSYVLEKNAYNINNRNLLNEFINQHHQYNTWITPLWPSRNIPLTTYVKINWNNLKALLFNKLNISKTDCEFAMDCNILLYTGKMSKNERVWRKVADDFKTGKIAGRYYDRFYSIYAYARLYYYGQHSNLFLSEDIVAKHLDDLSLLLNRSTFSLQHVFLANTLLFFGVDLSKHNQLIAACYTHLKEEQYKKLAAYYTSNALFDKNPVTGGPINVFGSSALTTSLYLEFLALHHKHLYGTYPG